MNIPRTIASFTPERIPFSEVEYVTLLQLAKKYSSDAWNPTYESMSGNEKKLVEDFKIALKNYLYKVGQGRYCCFCGSELSSHNGAKDLEHILAKNKKINLVFALNNLALACKDCNTPKGEKKVTVPAIDESKNDKVFLGTSDYVLVHPHIDKWDEHLHLDEYRRVLPNDERPDSKGSKTIEICAIYRKNAMRLADHFVWFGTDVQRYDDWVDFYSMVHTQIVDGKRLPELVAFAESFADALRSPDDTDAAAIEFILDELIQLAGLQSEAAFAHSDLAD